MCLCTSLVLSHVCFIAFVCLGITLCSSVFMYVLMSVAIYVFGRYWVRSFVSYICVFLRAVLLPFFSSVVRYVFSCFAISVFNSLCMSFVLESFSYLFSS